MRAKEFEIKKRDPNWRAMQDIRRSGAGGQHKDKKKAEKQGYEKHKGKDVAEGSHTTEKQILTRIRQIMYDRKLSGTDSNAGELLRLKQKLKDIRNKKDVAEDKAGWSDNSGTVKKYEPTKKGPMPSWRLNPDGTATDKNTGITYNRDGSVAKKEEGIGGMIAGGIGQFVGNKIDPLHGEIMRAHGEIAGRKAEYTIRKYMHQLQKALKQQLDTGDGSNESTEEGRKDYGYDSFGNSLRPGDDEGSTEPPNNFAIYINGKKWKVFQGRGQYADDQYEMQQFRQLQAMAARKSQETGKKWEVSRTLEPATK